MSKCTTDAKRRRHKIPPGLHQKNVQLNLKYMIQHGGTYMDRLLFSSEICQKGVRISRAKSCPLTLLAGCEVKINKD